ncbi:MAG: hypothetical protein IK059_05360 [Firmicutes bacterium]|nr:hypothetical protein [Bacillota bacterium]
MKKKISILLVLCLVFASISFMTACDTATATPAPAPDSDYAKALAMMKEMPLHGKSVKSVKEKQGYYKLNNLDVQFIEPDVYDTNIGLGSNYAKVSGLKNKEIQSQINNKIKDTFNELANDYSLALGVGEKIKEKELKNINAKFENYVYCNVYYNANNVLSVQFYRSLSVDKPGSEYNDYYSKMKVLNFDLATGELLNLGDCFEDGFDYVTYINNELLEFADKMGNADDGYYDFESGNYLCVGSNFETIWPDIQFYPSSWNETVTLVIDNNVKGFETMTASDYFTLDLEQGTAIAQRFATDESLFTDETEKYSLTYFDSSSKVADYYQDEEERDISAIIGPVEDEHDYSYWVTAKCPLNAPEAVLNLVKSEFKNTDEFEKNAKEWYQKRVVEDRFGGIEFDPSDYDVWASGSIYASRVGNYYGVRIERDLSAYSNNDPGSRYYQDLTYKTFDLKGNEITLKDIFKKGTDYELLLENVFFDNFEKSAKDCLQWGYESEQYYAWQAYDRSEFFDLAERLVKDINGIDINSDTMYFSFNNKIKVIEDWMGDSAYEDGGVRLNMLLNSFGYSAMYNDIGWNNLTLI